MRSGGASESRLAYVVDLLVQLRRDAESAEPELHRRDRALMPEGSRALQQPRLLMRWLDQLRGAGYWFPGSVVATVFRAQLLGLGVVGMGMGWFVTAALFAYDGSRPVNVVHVLAVLVGVQLVLLLLLGLVSVPRWMSQWVPGFRIVQDLLAWLSPGQITHWLAKRLPEPLRAPAMGRGGLGWGKDPWPTRILKWAAMVSAQSFGVTFNVGALAAALYLISFSDLAFSWSTTLSPDIERGHRITRLMSAPWAAWWPQAVPSRVLIESTLYYRQGGASAETEPVQWGGWWPFLVASVVVYGLVPRLILLSLACWRLKATIGRAMSETVGVDEVVDRLTTEVVSTQAIQAEEGTAGPAEGGASLVRSIPAGQYWGVNWGGLEVDIGQVRQHFAGEGREVMGLEAAGGAAGLEADTSTIEKIAAQTGATGAVILVKSWEPPMLEFLDFMGDLRKRMGKGRRLVVVLLGFDGDGRIGPPRAGDEMQWRRRLETLADDELTVATWEEEVA